LRQILSGNINFKKAMIKIGITQKIVFTASPAKDIAPFKGPGIKFRISVGSPSCGGCHHRGIINECRRKSLFRQPFYNIFTLEERLFVQGSRFSVDLPDFIV